MDLFDNIGKEQAEKDRPLADFMRPRDLSTFFGQEHLVGKNAPIALLLESRQPISMIFWGPPGVGKTTLARIFARAYDADLIALSAVTSGVADVREALKKGEANKRLGRSTILFIDEIHRFNKAQQDALLHSVERGTVVLIGATTENPSFEVISALLSRCRVYTLKLLSEEAMHRLLKATLEAYFSKHGEAVEIEEKAAEGLAQLANGDARELINGLELSAFLTKKSEDGVRRISLKAVNSAFQRKTARYDKNADAHYDTISAFIKSIRGSDPNAGLHYLARMLEGGEEPLFIARRLIILASEDIGNADPQALVLATSAYQAVHAIGLPEARLVLAQATTYLASAPKSNASYTALKSALKDLQTKAVAPIPMHIRNAPTKFMAEQGYGKNYQYPHDHPGGFVEEEYLPDNLKGSIYYKPTGRGREETILKRLRQLWKKYSENQGS